MAGQFETELQNQIRTHAGWGQLEKFGGFLAAQPLDEESLRTFMASSARFFREIPGGILALASRVTDDRITDDRFGAVRAGANVLLAAVDEFGLGSDGSAPGGTHHELFIATVEALGLNEADLLDSDYVIAEAEELAAVTHDGYRSGTVAAAVGFHFASEITSDLEFRLCFDGIAAHAAAYGLNERDTRRSLAFYFVHTVVEPAHGASSAAAVRMYAANEASRSQILDGALQFMDAYGRFWSALNEQLAGEHQQIVNG